MNPTSMEQEAGFNIVNKLMGITNFGAEWVLWLLLVASVVSIAIIIERIIYFYTFNVKFSVYKDKLLGFLNQNDFKSAKELCQNNPSLEATVVLTGIENWQKNTKALDENLNAVILSEKPRLERGLIVLGTLGSNAPFIGLFGTVVGIIKAFHDLSLHPEGGPSVVMAGISEALIATAVGLIVAIPAVIAYNVLNKIIKGKVLNAQSMQKVLLSIHQS